MTKKRSLGRRAGGHGGLRQERRQVQSNKQVVARPMRRSTCVAMQASMQGPRGSDDDSDLQEEATKKVRVEEPKSPDLSTLSLYSPQRVFVRPEEPDLVKPSGVRPYAPITADKLFDKPSGVRPYSPITADKLFDKPSYREGGRQAFDEALILEQKRLEVFGPLLLLPAEREEKRIEDRDTEVGTPETEQEMRRKSLDTLTGEDVFLCSVEARRSALFRSADRSAHKVKPRRNTLEMQAGMEPDGKESKQAVLDWRVEGPEDKKAEEINVRVRMPVVSVLERGDYDREEAVPGSKSERDDGSGVAVRVKRPQGKSELIIPWLNDVGDRPDDY